MLLLFISLGLCTTDSEQNSVFRGSWAHRVQNMTSIRNMSRGQLTLTLNRVNPKDVHGIHSVVADFEGGRDAWPSGSRLRYAGLPSEDNRMYVMVETNESMLYSVIKSLIEPYIENCNFRNYTHMSGVLESINQEARDLNIRPFPSLMIFNISSNRYTKHPFMSGRGAIGSITYDGVRIPFFARYIAPYNIVSEGKVFAVVSSFCVVLIFHAWLSLAKNFESVGSMQQLCYHSYIFHVGFDFSFALFLLDCGQHHHQLIAAYSFIVFTLFFIYFQFQLRGLTQIWSAHQGDINNDPPSDVSKRLICFFVETAAVICTTTFCFNRVFESPLPSLIFLSSALIPQIIFSANKQTIRKKDNVFVVLISISKLIPLWYFTFFSNSAPFTHSTLYGTCVTLWVAVQVGIILAQNKYGGDVILPNCLRKLPYDYRAGFIEMDDTCPICLCKEKDNPCLMTPCGHEFHVQCLSEWMNVKMECPVCRSSLPVLV